jgi:hypothetical protein
MGVNSNGQPVRMAGIPNCGLYECPLKASRDFVHIPDSGNAAVTPICALKVCTNYSPDLVQLGNTFPLTGGIAVFDVTDCDGKAPVTYHSTCQVKCASGYVAVTGTADDDQGNFLFKCQDSKLLTREPDSAQIKCEAEMCPPSGLPHVANYTAAELLKPIANVLPSSPNSNGKLRVSSQITPRFCHDWTSKIKAYPLNSGCDPKSATVSYDLDSPQTPISGSGNRYDIWPRVEALFTLHMSSG